MPNQIKLFIIAISFVLGFVSANTKAQDFDRLRADVAKAEGKVSDAIRNELRHSPLRSATYVEERLTDGELFYRLHDYMRASIVFTDIVDNYPNHRAYPDALFLLGESLFQAEEYLGARTRFREVLNRSSEVSFRSYSQRALGRLIEVAIKTEDFEGVDRYFSQVGGDGSAEVKSATSYFRGKYLYTKGSRQNASMDDALSAFSAVGINTPYRLRARYFLGVVHTARKEYDKAVEVFQKVSQAKARSAKERRVVELANLALGRLFYELDMIDRSIDAYQRVPRTSPHFDAALYEIAWAFIRVGDATRAERALEVLSVAAPSSNHIPDSRILRGNLLLRNGRHDEAEKVFKLARKQFGPVLRSLETIRKTHEADIEGHFRELVRANIDDFDAEDFLPRSARKWTELDESFSRSLRAMSSLAETKKAMVETDDLIVRLNAALSGNNRVSVFLDLRRARETTTSIRNRLSKLRRAVIIAEEKAIGPVSPEVQQIRQERRALEKDFGGLPVGDEDFAARDGRRLRKYRDFERRLSELDVELSGLDARVVATNRFMADTGMKENPEMNSLLEELHRHEVSIEEYRKAMKETRRAVEVAKLQIGVGDQQYEEEKAIRARYTKLVERERALTGGNPEADQLLRRIAKMEQTLDTRDAKVDEVLDERVADIRRVLTEESGKMAGYQSAMTKLSSETEDVVGTVSAANFINVRNRFFDLVLRADVGRVDVSWARREERRMRIEMLTQERSREIQALDNEFRDIMSNGESAEGEDQ